MCKIESHCLPGARFVMFLSALTLACQTEIQEIVTAIHRKGSNEMSNSKSSNKMYFGPEELHSKNCHLLHA